MPTTPDLRRVAAIVRRRLPSAEYHVFLFGSRAEGGGRPVSDWDIGVLGPAPVRGAVLQAIRDDLDDLPTLHRFDVVDLSTVPDEFRDAALRGALELT
jgi:predicted nucleotidyltransferase